jgi:hypothetical protein
VAVPTIARSINTNYHAQPRAGFSRRAHSRRRDAFPRTAGHALHAAKRKAEAEFNAADQRLFIARVHAKLLERLRGGNILNARDMDLPIKDQEDTREGR